MMHINNDAFSYLDDDDIKGCEVGSQILQECFSMLTTTSPNSLFLASLDATRGQFAKEGTAILDKAVIAINDIKQSIREGKGRITLLDDSDNVKSLQLLIDPLKLTIQVSNDESLSVDDTMCEDEGIYCELINKKYISYALSPCSTHDTLRTLKESLIRHNYESSDNNKTKIMKKRNYNDAPTGLAYLNVVKITQHLSISIPIESSIDRISVETICVYPPGIPLLVKGETITMEHVNALIALKSTFKSNSDNISKEGIVNDYIDTGSSITGWSDTNYETIKVLKD
jgi:arginine/lysine/ornithine decarboxylase